MRGTSKVQGKSTNGRGDAPRAPRSEGRKRKGKAHSTDTDTAEVLSEMRFSLTEKGWQAVDAVRGVQPKDTNPKDRAASARVDLTLFPASARIYGALGLTEGDLKYGGYNWRAAGIRVSVYVAAISRHLEKFLNGETCDAVTHVPHLANAIAGLAVLIDGIEQGNVTDDRPPVQNIAKLFERCEEITKHLHTVFPPAKSPGRYTSSGRK